MIVFIAGMPRSGSTFSFNIARCLLEQRGRLSHCPTGAIGSILQQAVSSDHLILKGHEADEQTTHLARLGAIRVICTVRRPEEAIASWISTFGFSLEQAVADMERWYAMYQQVASCALCVDFDEIERRPAHAAFRIARHLVPDVTVAEVAGIVRPSGRGRVERHCREIEQQACDMVDLGFSYYHPETYFHRRHVRSPDQRSPLEGPVVEELRRRFPLAA